MTSRYFLELAYNGAPFSGFQIQPTVKTVQGEIEHAFNVILKTSIKLTTSSRTDAGVHALQNFFHFDSELEICKKNIYNLNALLPREIAITNIYKMDSGAHSRFDATSRRYRYYIYDYKNPFLMDRGWYYPFKLDIELLREAAGVLMEYEDFTSFSKRNTQVHSFLCHIMEASWEQTENTLVFTVEANRFLRGMVRALVATMLKVGRGTISIATFKAIIDSKNCANADFSAPSQGLFLEKVNYPYKLTAVE